MVVLEEQAMGGGHYILGGLVTRRGWEIREGRGVRERVLRRSFRGRVPGKGSSA